MATLTKREAIRECKRLWKEIKKSGLTKVIFLRCLAGEKWIRKGYNSNCPLCEYACLHPTNDRCEKCPLRTQYNEGCFSLGYQPLIQSSSAWFKAIQGLK